MVIFRPHNVYGPDMGWEHVIPQFVVRMHSFASIDRARSDSAARHGQRNPGVRTISTISWTASMSCLIEANIAKSTTSERAKKSPSPPWRQTLAAIFGREIELVPGAPAEGCTHAPLSRRSPSWLLSVTRQNPPYRRPAVERPMVCAMTHIWPQPDLLRPV